MRRALAALLLTLPALAQAQRALPPARWSAPSGALAAPALPSMGALRAAPGASAPLALPALPPLQALPRLRPLTAAPEGPAPDPVAAFALDAARHFGNAPVVEKAPSGLATEAAPGEGEIEDDIRRSPFDNAGRERLVRELFVKAGADPAEVRAMPIGRGQHNLMVVKPGRTDRILVVGGHHDKVHRGQGTIDNWTGASMVVHLYQTLKDVETEHTIVFMTFGREEEGLVGSRAYVRSLSDEELGRMDAMLNLDTLAVDGTFSWKNNSSPGMLDAVREAAREGGYDLEEKTLWGGDSDSSSFKRAGVPAMTLFGASPEVIFDIIHSDEDNFGRFSLPHYRNALQLSAALLRRLDAGGRPAGPAAAAAAR